MPNYAPNFQPPNYANNYAGIIRRCLLVGPQKSGVPRSFEHSETVIACMSKQILSLFHLKKLKKGDIHQKKRNKGRKKRAFPKRAKKGEKKGEHLWERATRHKVCMVLPISLLFEQNLPPFRAESAGGRHLLGAGIHCAKVSDFSNVYASGTCTCILYYVGQLGNIHVKIIAMYYIVPHFPVIDKLSITRQFCYSRFLLWNVRCLYSDPDGDFIISVLQTSPGRFRSWISYLNKPTSNTRPHNQ